MAARSRPRTITLVVLLIAGVTALVPDGTLHY